MAILKLFGKEISVSTTSDHETESNNTNQASSSSSDHTYQRRPSDEKNDRASKKRKPESDKGKVRESYPQVPTISLSSEFLRIIGDGVESVFLYRKKLEKTDVEKHQDKLLVTKKENLMDEFLTKEECQTLMMRREGGLTSKIDVVGVDKTGRELEMLISRWGADKVMKIVLNRNWYRMVEANGAKAGHWVDLWGYRRRVDGNNKICVAFNFSS
ncbi:hypothetical protein CASFOL_007003 [Castilleja foliolosa]|uniref:Uncharacterized protein n=1 Tax=Castilleja foliolosa TaxID=1961234 RepID=A0ABD3E7Z8_9LAMI